MKNISTIRCAYFVVVDHAYDYYFRGLNLDVDPTRITGVTSRDANSAFPVYDIRARNESRSARWKKPDLGIYTCHPPSQYVLERDQSSIRSSAAGGKEGLSRTIYHRTACQGSSPLGILRGSGRKRKERRRERKHETNVKRRTVFPAAGPRTTPDEMASL